MWRPRRTPDSALSSSPSPINRKTRREEGAALTRRPPGDRERGYRGACLVGEIAGDAGTGEHDDAHRHDVEHAVVALENDFHEKVERVRATLAKLDPYGDGKDLLKLEDANFSPADGKTPVKLDRYAISAKRYVLFMLDENGKPVIRKASAHGLGHLRPPYERRTRPRLSEAADSSERCRRRTLAARPLDENHRSRACRASRSSRPLRSLRTWMSPRSAAFGVDAGIAAPLQGLQ